MISQYLGFDSDYIIIGLSAVVLILLIIIAAASLIMIVMYTIHN